MMIKIKGYENHTFQLHQNHKQNYYSGLPNESTALMRALVDKKSKNAKSTGLQNVPNESTG